MFTDEEMVARIRRHAESWSSGDAEAVAGFYAEDTVSAHNGGEPIVGRSAILEMVRSFMRDVPDLNLKCDDARAVGRNGLMVWTLEGTYASTGNAVSLPGWEEMEFTENGLIAASRGRYDNDDYERQTNGG